MFSLFAPRLEKVQLLASFLEWKAQPMERRVPDDGSFAYTPTFTLPDGQYSYKFRIKKRQEDENWVDLNDPYATGYDCERDTSVAWVKGGKRALNDSTDYEWLYDDVKMPSNRDLILYELYIADFADNGKFSGVIDRLDYLRYELGVNCLALMPLYESKGFQRDWGYAIRNFFSLKLSYGTTRDFKRLVDECHKRGMRVSMDGVFNHSSDDCPLVKIDREYWYYKGKHKENDPWHWGPEFNYDYEDEKRNIKPARQYVSDVVRYWMGEFHLDGIRFDAAKQMDNMDILRELDSVCRESARQNQPFYSQAEWIPINPLVIKARGGPLDACWSLSLCYFLYGAVTDEVEIDHMKNVLAERDYVNYIDCHDNSRLLYSLGRYKSIFGDDAFTRMKLAALVLVTAVGVPLLYMGDEMGESYSFHEDDEEKTSKAHPMPWHYLKNAHNQQLFQTFKRLFALRLSIEALRHGNIEYFHEHHDQKILAYSRDSQVAVICHFSSHPACGHTIHNMPESGRWKDGLTGEEVTVGEDRKLTMDLKPYAGFLLLKQQTE